jgi:hypothetical protein
MLLGFVPDGLVSARIFPRGFFDFVPPFMTAIALLLGYVVARWMRDRTAVWAWLPGVLWFAYGAWSELLPMGLYESRHGLSPSALDHVFAQLLTSNCGDTECLYQFFYTVPAVLAIAYSLSSWLTLRFSRGDSAAVVQP